jgi:hypothetical protein
MGLGRAAGEGRALIIPTGGQKELTLRGWRDELPGDFAEACRRSYEIVFGPRSDGEADSSSDSTLEKIGLGAATTLLGAFAGYWFGNRSSWKQRRYQEGIALRDELSSLDTAVSRLIRATGEETATAETNLLAADGAAQLRIRVRASASKVDRATSKIDELRRIMRLSAPVSPAEHKSRAGEIEQAWSNVRDETETVIAAIRKEAAISWLSGLSLRFRGK